MNEKLFIFIRCVKIPPKNTWYDRVYAPASTRKKDIDCCKLTPTLARQTWRHNYAIGHKEYLISTLLEYTIP